MKTPHSILALLITALLFFLGLNAQASPVAVGSEYTLGTGHSSDFTPMNASKNLLYQLTPSVVANSKPKQENTSVSADVLVDGLIPSGYPMNSRYTLGDNAILQ